MGGTEFVFKGNWLVLNTNKALQRRDFKKKEKNESSLILLSIKLRNGRDK